MKSSWKDKHPSHLTLMNKRNEILTVAARLMAGMIGNGKSAKENAEAAIEHAIVLIQELDSE